MPPLSKFCCCPLKQGTVAYGIVILILSVFSTILKLVLLYSILGAPHNNPYGQIQDENGRPWQQNNQIDPTSILITVGIAAFFILNMPCVSLIFGAVKERRFYMLPWIYLNAGGLFGVTLAAIFAPMVLATIHPAYLLIIPLALLILFPFWYLWLGVYSYYEILVIKSVKPGILASCDTDDVLMSE